MNEARQEFMRTLDISGYSYSTVGDNQLTVAWTDNAIPPITTTFTFSHDSSDVSIKSLVISTPSDKQVDTLYICSALNMQNRWVKFYLNGEN